MNKQTCEFLLQEQTDESPYWECIGTFATYEETLSKLEIVLAENKRLGISSELSMIKNITITNKDWKS